MGLHSVKILQFLTEDCGEMVRVRTFLQLWKVLKYSSAPDASKILYGSIHGFRVMACLEFQRCLNLSFGVGSKIVPRSDLPRLRLHLFPNLHLIISYGMVRIGITEKKNLKLQKFASVILMLFLLRSHKGNSIPCEYSLTQL